MTEVTIGKYGHEVNISREVAVTHGLVEPTTEERAELARRDAEHEARREAERVDLDRLRGELDAMVRRMTHIITLKAYDNMAEILTEHAEVDGDCGLCTEADALGEYWSTPWPCEPVLLVARILGIAPPAGAS